MHSGLNTLYMNNLYIIKSIMTLLTTGGTMLQSLRLMGLCFSCHVFVLWCERYLVAVRRIWVIIYL